MENLKKRDLFCCILAYSLPFIINFFWPLIFIHYYLLYIILSSIFFSSTLFFLALFTFAIQILPLLNCFIILAGNFCGFFAWILLTLFVATNVFIFYFIISKLLKFIDNAVVKKIVFIVLIFFLIIWLDQFFLMPFGNVEGYCCFHPLVPLMYYDLPKNFVAIYGLISSTVILLFFSVIWKNRSQLFIFTFFIFIINLSFINKKSINCDQLKICVAATIFDQFGKKSADEYADEISMLLKKICKANPNAKLILFPESSFPYALNKYPELVLYFQDLLSEFKVDTHLILGTHNETDKLFNSCYLINKFGVKDIYHKRHGLLFTERDTKIFNSTFFLNNIFLNNKRAFSQNKNNNIFWKILDLEFMPLICSEFFFQSRKPNYSNLILAIVNDAWYKKSWLPQLLLNCARLKSVAWQTDIIYVSHQFNLYITKNCEISIERFSI